MMERLQMNISQREGFAAFFQGDAEYVIGESLLCFMQLPAISVLM